MFRIKSRALPYLSIEPTGRKTRLPSDPAFFALLFSSFPCACLKRKPRPTDQHVSALFRPRSQEKKTFGERLLNAACRDSGAIGAGYEGELKDGRFKGKKK